MELHKVTDSAIKTVLLGWKKARLAGFKGWLSPILSFTIRQSLLTVTTLTFLAFERAVLKKSDLHFNVVNLV
jgi:hypothetical protein